MGPCGGQLPRFQDGLIPCRAKLDGRAAPALPRCTMASNMPKHGAAKPYACWLAARLSFRPSKKLGPTCLACPLGAAYGGVDRWRGPEGRVVSCHPMGGGKWAELERGVIGNARVDETREASPRRPGDFGSCPQCCHLYGIATGYHGGFRSRAGKIFPNGKGFFP